jgi:hypothetical protein
LGFLGRAKELMGGIGSADSSQSQTQYYRVACPEGHLLQGIRTEGYQAIRCPDCGEGLFILPRRPLPDPPAPPGADPKPRAAVPPPPPVDDSPIEYQDAPGQFLDADAEIEWEEPEPDDEVDEVVATEPDLPTPAPPRPAARKPRPTPSRPSGSRPNRRPAAEVEADEEPRELTAPSPHRKRRNRTALLIFGVIALVALTIGFGAWKQRRQNLPRIADTNRREGLEALRNGVLDVAKQKLAIAAGALESLGDGEAANVRQAADEASILADLASLSLEEIVEEVATKEDGPSRFESIYKDRAVILDAEIEDRVDGAPTITYRILAGTGPRPKIGFIDLAGFRLLNDRKPGDRVTFGGRLASIRLRDDGRWAVALQPKSGVYVRSAEAWKALESLGWSAETTGAPKP